LYSIIVVPPPTPEDERDRTRFRLAPGQSIPAMGRYLCFIDQGLKTSLKGDRRVLIAASYRTSYKKVNATGGVPPKNRAYAARVAHYLKEYAPPGKK